MIIGGHRAVDQDRQRNGVAVFRDLGKVDRDLAPLGGLATGEFRDLGGGFGPPTAARTAPAPPSANISRRDLCLMTFLRPATARADPLAIMYATVTIT
jgi:hypothetical protein